MAYDTTNTFILSRNNKGDNPKRPDYRGEVNIDGKLYEIAGWLREKKSDKSKFISGTVKPKVDKRAQQAQEQEEPKQEAQQGTAKPFGADDEDEDKPFG